MDRRRKRASCPIVSRRTFRSKFQSLYCIVSTGLRSRVVHTKQYAGINEHNLPADHRTPSIYRGAEEYYN
ncbi:hypothetical protein EG68_12503 [Paragonimus skrjabini miyazakii]|uniref:Uncharacterized protein n=1 Tax=Paragonimus skrjabini miyazakii TaxID=59628 RepID=A0A8S9YJT1_9TREM|nr:hypothetical protein EG68_12503 [Paragonimus skrjabini miyazakii]